MTTTRHLARLRSVRAALGALALLAASSLPAQDLAELAFLAGTWRESTPQATTEEAWLGPRGGTMVATNLSLRGGRAGFEFLRIEQREGRVVYLASPGGRHPPVEFALKELSPGRVVFENAAHDFPQRVIYRRDGKRLVARIEGRLRGEARGRDWVFERVR
ncbi:MAG: hypothetical protein KIT17_12030 [Rubrivivax sp.]|nr:hypothetical protein [Rubrivivax sp.]